MQCVVVWQLIDTSNPTPLREGGRESQRAGHQGGGGGRRGRARGGRPAPFARRRRAETPLRVGAQPRQAGRGGPITTVQCDPLTLHSL